MILYKLRHRKRECVFSNSIVRIKREHTTPHKHRDIAITSSPCEITFNRTKDKFDELHRGAGCVMSKKRCSQYLHYLGITKLKSFFFQIVNLTMYFELNRYLNAGQYHFIVVELTLKLGSCDEEVAQPEKHLVLRSIWNGFLYRY